MKWDNFNAAHYLKVLEARPETDYNIGFLIRQYAEINSHLTLEECCQRFIQKFKQIIK